MPRPDTRARIAFDLAAGGVGDFFTLDDPTKGELNGTAFKLAGDILEDVTADVRNITVRRGRSRELERYQAGAATVVLNSQDRKYDPSYKVTQSATGGDSVYEIDVSGTTYVVHEFTTVGTATFTPGVVPLRGVEYLVVAGGGGGGRIRGGGGGAGGVLTNIGSSIDLTAARSVIVGAGGLGATESASTNGGNSSFGIVTASGGGAGARPDAATVGGSGGGGGGFSSTSGVAGTTGQGNAGGDGSGNSGGGGGGAGGVGANGTTDVGGDGGAGIVSTITGTSVTYAGGGGGMSNAGTAVGGAGGGGNGATTLSGTNDATSGTDGLGGGGGGANNASGSVGGDGGSGIVIIRYPKVAFPSPFVASMRPRKAVQIVTAGQQVFNGVVDDWDLAFSLDGDHQAVVKITDGFAFLAQQLIEPHTATAQTTGERIAAILDRSEIAWPAGRREIEDGVATLQADAIGGTANAQPVNALQYLQKVEEAEQGALFIAADGQLVFRDRGGLAVLSPTKFADDGTGIEFSSIDAQYGSEELRNRITVSRLNGGTATAEDTQSITDYGAIDYEIRDSLLADDTQAQDLADEILARYSQPILRINGIEVTVNALTPAQADDVMALELGDLVQVVYTPSGIGDPIDQFVRVDSIEHNIDPGVHRVRLSFSEGQPPALVLDSLLLGLLDVNALGF